LEKTTDSQKKEFQKLQTILPRQNFSWVFLNYSEASLGKKRTYIQPKHATKTIQATKTAQDQYQFPQIYELLLTCYPPFVYYQATEYCEKFSIVFASTAKCLSATW